jgi:predicted lipoprotein with Yx(FWY)xxD motif
MKKIGFLSENGLLQRMKLTENRTQINTTFDELIAQNNGNPKLYFMKEKLTENCNYNQCKIQLEQLQNLVKSDTEGDYKVIIMEDIMNELY